MNTPNNTPPTTVRVQEGSDVTVDGVGTIRVLVVRNDGSGQAAYENVPAGSPVQAVVRSQPGQAVRVNGQPAAPGQTLREGDKVSVTPERVSGA